jgi:DNA invertase Pin-like site-specific DNA recombinase
VKVALYARISTHDGRQNLDNQLGELRTFCKMPFFDSAKVNESPWIIAGEYTDQDSGAKERRKGLDEMTRDAGAGKFKLVLAWDLSRLTRGGPAKAFEIISRLKGWGVEFWSLKEPHFRTSGPLGEVFIALAAHIGREERRIMQERVAAGLARARKEGKILGRPVNLDVDPGRLLRYLEEGRSAREMAELENTSPQTILRRLRKLKGTA